MGSKGKGKMNSGDYVYYYAYTGDTVPAVIKRVSKKRVLIVGVFIEGRQERWVCPSKLELQADNP